MWRGITRKWRKILAFHLFQTTDAHECGHYARIVECGNKVRNYSSSGVGIDGESAEVRISENTIFQESKKTVYIPPYCQ